MADKPMRGKSKRKLPNPSTHSLRNVEQMEKLALMKANKAISAIENAVAVWDASENKPEDLRMRINRLRFVHDELSNWEKKMLKAIAAKSDLAERVQRLREFSDICYMHG